MPAAQRSADASSASGPLPLRHAARELPSNANQDERASTETFGQLPVGDGGVRVKNCDVSAPAIVMCAAVRAVALLSSTFACVPRLSETEWKEDSNICMSQTWQVPRRCLTSVWLDISRASPFCLRLSRVLWLAASFAPSCHLTARGKAESRTR